MPWFCTDNHFATNPPWSQPDITMLQTCNPLQIAERGCKMISWGHHSFYLVSTLPYSLPLAPPSISGKLLYMGGYGTERLGYSLNYLCKVSSLYAFETQFEGLVLLFPQGLWFTRVTTRDHYLIITPAPSGGLLGSSCKPASFMLQKCLPADRHSLIQMTYKCVLTICRIIVLLFPEAGIPQSQIGSEIT